MEGGMDFVPWLFPAIGVFVVLAVLINLSVFTIHTKQATIVEGFGKFERIAEPG
jgi:regulator of protease activity HflC (stomatin/prohibitin superfamily)